MFYDNPFWGEICLRQPITLSTRISAFQYYDRTLLQDDPLIWQLKYSVLCTFKHFNGHDAYTAKPEIKWSEPWYNGKNSGSTDRDEHSTTQYIQVLNNVNIPQSAHCRESYTIENRHNDIKLKRVNVSIFLLNLIFNKEEWYFICWIDCKNKLFKITTYALALYQYIPVHTTC